ncbi:MAG: methylenetetrahydrofolate reductase [Xanthomonadales bacterium]|nr:methylenetetrahydrofolate reductase [Xanthomonadales bacterium]
MNRTFRQAVQSDAFTISAELTLNHASRGGDIRRQADVLGPLVDGIQVNDNPPAWTHMSAISASSLLLQSGVDPVPILTCRDRNRLALHSDLLGCRALGITSLLLTRGRRVIKKHKLHGSTVFDIGGRDLIAMANDLNEEDGARPGEAFFIGTGAKVFHPKPEWRAESLSERARAGARFLQTQLCFNTNILKAWMQRLVDLKKTWDYSVIVSLTPLPSAKTAAWLKEQYSDSKIPKAVIDRLEAARDPRAEGIAICAELMNAVREIPGISGVHLMTTGEPELLAAAIRESGLRT